MRPAGDANIDGTRRVCEKDVHALRSDPPHLGSTTPKSLLGRCRAYGGCIANFDAGGSSAVCCPAHLTRVTAYARRGAGAARLRCPSNVALRPCAGPPTLPSPLKLKSGGITAEKFKCCGTAGPLKRREARRWCTGAGQLRTRTRRPAHAELSNL